MNVLLANPRATGNYDPDEASAESGLLCEDASLTIQSQREDADINVLVKRFGVTGELPMSQRVPLNLDVDEVLDYKICMDYVRAAQSSFLSLPADVRASFDNDAARFVAFAEDRKNLEKLREWGLAPKAGASEIEARGVPPADAGAAPAPAG